MTIWVPRIWEIDELSWTILGIRDFESSFVFIEAADYISLKLHLLKNARTHLRCEGEGTKIDDDNIRRKRLCPIVPKIFDPAGPCVARFAMANLVSSATTHGEPLFVQRSASIASGIAGQAT
jgi:hypothetical protein